MQSHEVGF